MAVTKPRTKLVNFRLSEEEFRNLREACMQFGARSLSDFARTAVLKTFNSDQGADGMLHVRIADLDSKVAQIELSMRQLRQSMSTEAAAAN